MMKKHQSLFLITITLLSLSTHASQGDRYYQEVESAKNSIGQSLNAQGFKNFNEEAYCSDAACVSEMNNPSQQKYFNNDDAMVNDGVIGLGSNPNASNIVTGFNDRPKYNIDPNDPSLKRAKGYMDDSYNISHGISSKYHDCDDGSVCNYTPIDKECQVPTNQTASCFQEPIISKETEDAIGSCPIGWENRDNQCYKTIEECRFNMSGSYVSVYSCNWNAEDSTSFFWEGKNVYGNPEYRWGNHVKTVHSSCWQQNAGYADSETTYYEICGPVTISQPWDLHCRDGYTLLDGVCIKNKITWKNNCVSAPTQCNLNLPVCIEGPDTKIVNGIPLTLDCWKSRLDYDCSITNTCQPILNPSLRRSAPSNIVNCKEKEKTCDVEILGVCLSESVTLECEDKQCEQIGLTCGEESFCLDGDCYNPPRQSNEDFDESAAALAALGAAAANLNADTLTIFSGVPAFCSKKPIGLSDCCADDGWGNDIGLTACNEEEKGLAEAKKDGLTVSLGEFCAEEVLGVCIRKKKSYCQFDSKMSRIVQEQGRPQLGLNFGSKKSPNCRGITPEELQQVDFSNIDFSDFYEDMQNNMELPDMDKVQDSIVDKFEDMQK